MRQLRRRKLPAVGRGRRLRLRADDLVIPHLQVFPQCGFTCRPRAVCGDFQTAYLPLRRMRGCFCAKFQPAEILPGLQQKSPPQAEKRERKKAPNGLLEVLKRPVYKGFLRSKQGGEG